MKPHAPLILVWNQESASDWFGTLRTLYEPLDLGSPQYYRMLWRSMFDTAAYHELFEPKEETSVEWDLGMNEDQVVNRLLSKSYLTEAHLNGKRRTEFESELRRRIRAGNKTWVNQEVSLQVGRMTGAD